MSLIYILSVSCSSREFVVRRAKMEGHIKIGRHVFTNPDISFMSLLDGLNVANLGSEILKQFAITYDQKNKRIRWVKADAEKTLTSRSKIRHKHP